MPPTANDEPLDLANCFRVVTGPGDCPYLDGEQMSLEYMLVHSMTGGQFQWLLERGWRKQGSSFFRPKCAACRECRSIRVPVRDFRPTKSQRRAANKNKNVRLEVRPAAITAEHMRIYRAYHEDMHTRRGWPLGSFSRDRYAESFLSGEFPFTHDFLYYRGNELLAVGLVDVLPDALSSVYFYHDPSWRELSPGTYTVQEEIRFARETGREFLYLGYWVADCGSMSYKNRFRPHELLDSYPDDGQPPSWSRITD